jgi:hypothetical protein
MSFPSFILGAASVGLLASAGCGDSAAVSGPRAATSVAGSPSAASAGKRAGEGTTASEPGNAAQPTTETAEKASGATASVALPPRDSRGVYETSFDDIKFPMEKTETFQRSMLTPKVNGLSGQSIRILGWMYPTFRQKGLKEFVLVRDNMECCFGPGAALFDCILVKMAPGKTTEFVSNRPISVEGAFRVEEFMGPDGRPLAIYQMTADEVK